MDNDKQLPEAPISIHVDSYLDGFHVGWTKRLDGDNLSEQVAGMGAFIKKLKDEGYMPSWNAETNAKVQNGSSATPTESEYTCPKCGAVAIRKTGLTKTKRPWAGLFCMDVKEHVTWE